MIHKRTAIDLFPTWYKSIDPAVDGTTVDNRIKAINQIVSDAEHDTWLDIVRISLGLTPVDSSNVEGIENSFKAEDVNFPLTSNEALLKVLSQILLCFLFESENEVKHRTATAVCNAVFFGQYTKSDIPYYEYAIEVRSLGDVRNTEDQSANRQALDDALETMEEDSDAEVLMDYTDQVAVVKTVRFLYDENAKLKQESNILWWLFGQYSKSNNQYFIEAGANKMIFASALELAELNVEKSNLLSARHILHRALFISNENKQISVEVSTEEALDATSTQITKYVSETFLDVNELTPCLLALKLSGEFNDKMVWKGVLKSKLPGADIDSKFNPVDMSYQIYNEMLFLIS